MWDNGHHASPIFVIAFYGFCHLCTAVTMFKELDMREAGDTYFAVSAICQLHHCMGFRSIDTLPRSTSCCAVML
jgi:hypothetical protein